MKQRRTKRGWPKIVGLSGFDEQRLPAERGFRSVGYISPHVGIVAMGLTPDEGRQQVASLLQLNATHGNEIVPVAVTFGGVSGWKCRTWRNRLCYILFPGTDAVLMHVDPRNGGIVDEAQIEAQLHTLTVE